MLLLPREAGGEGPRNESKGDRAKLWSIAEQAVDLGRLLDPLICRYQANLKEPNGSPSKGRVEERVVRVLGANSQRSIHIFSTDSIETGEFVDGHCAIMAKVHRDVVQLVSADGPFETIEMALDVCEPPGVFASP